MKVNPKQNDEKWENYRLKIEWDKNEIKGEPKEKKNDHNQIFTFSMFCNICK